MANRDDAQNLQQAFSLHRTGRFAEAAKLYRKVIRKNLREANALHSLGIIESAGARLKQGKLTDALTALDRLLSIGPGTCRPSTSAARCCCFNNAYKLNPRRFASRINLHA